MGRRPKNKTMKGRLYKTEQGWQVIYKGEDPLFLGLQILPLHPDDTIGIGQEDKEIEFQIIEFPVPPSGPVSNSISKYAKLVDYSWITQKEGDLTVNFKPLPEFDEPADKKYTQYELNEAMSLARKTRANKWGMDGKESIDFLYSNVEIMRKLAELRTKQQNNE